MISARDAPAMKTAFVDEFTFSPPGEIVSFFNYSNTQEYYQEEDFCGGRRLSLNAVFESYVSPAGPVGASASQRCPPDTRATDGEANVERRKAFPANVTCGDDTSSVSYADTFPSEGKAIRDSSPAGRNDISGVRFRESGIRAE